VTAPAVDAARIRWSVDPARLATELESKRLLVVLHGYGSNAADLFGLREYLPADLVIVAVEGLEPTQNGGWAWFPITVNPETGELQRNSADVDAAAQSLLTWLAELDAQLAPALGEFPVSLLGFSQGGAMSLELLRHAPERFDSAVVLAGFAVPHESAESSARDAALAAVKPRVFWGRDPQDPVIAPRMIEFTRKWLPEHTDLDARLYSHVGHSISLEELDDVNRWLSAGLSSD